MLQSWIWAERALCQRMAHVLKLLNHLYNWAVTSKDTNYKEFTLWFTMSGTSNGHPIEVHIGYCPCIRMNKLFNNKHGKVFLHPSQQVQWELHHMYLQATLKKKSVVVYEPGWHYWDSTLLAPRLSQGSDNVGHPNESLVGEKAYLWWVTECTYGARTRIYGGSHKLNTIGEVCCQQLVLFWHTLNF